MAAHPGASENDALLADWTLATTGLSPLISQNEPMPGHGPWESTPRT